MNKRDTELNTHVMQAWYYVNHCRDEPLQGRSRLHAEFGKMHPELHLTRQNIVYRKYVIVKKEYLSSIKLAEIRREVGNVLTHEEVPVEIEETSESREYSFSTLLQFTLN